jgi:hypothetical protein
MCLTPLPESHSDTVSRRYHRLRLECLDNRAAQRCLTPLAPPVLARFARFPDRHGTRRQRRHPLRRRDHVRRPRLHGHRRALPTAHRAGSRFAVRRRLRVTPPDIDEACRRTGGGEAAPIPSYCRLPVNALPVDDVQRTGHRQARGRATAGPAGSPAPNLRLARFAQPSSALRHQSWSEPARRARAGGGTAGSGRRWSVAMTRRPGEPARQRRKS